MVAQHVDKVDLLSIYSLARGCPWTQHSACLTGRVERWEINEESSKIHPQHVFEHRSHNGGKLGLWIDPTNTDRYYFVDEDVK
ncbi:hypothetical protein KIN20_006604 [Parelaphostrongylus tenuis]|uniref:Uncharacterized protein n=1 Tax=Parelaphostrongylus tenuis TaxID=148309 RepID=A0AAD5MN83_PARTN|nr:hypothetical protein KIN20_006604 [Parelaphostrongylus tenuis]